MIDIRMKTGLIVKRGSMFLVGRQVGTGLLRWSDSPYDAWITRTRESASLVAKRIGGDICLFNPVSGQIRGYQGR